MSDLAFQSSSRVNACPKCCKHPLHSTYIQHMTEDEYVMELLAGRATKSRAGDRHTLPLNGRAKWIHILEEENEPTDLRNPE